MSFKTLKVLLVGLVLAGSFHSQATIIAATDFDGRVVTDNTASNLTWDVNGISSPGNLSADFDLFTTTAANDIFAVDSNIQNESPWQVNVDLNVLVSNDIDLLLVTLDAFIFNNAGALQTAQRHLDFNAAIFNISAPATALATINQNVYVNNGSFVNGQSVSFDFTGVSLLAGNSYFLQLTASGQRFGNNAGFDNLVINGDVNAVPEPSALVLLAFGLLGLASRRFTK